MLAAVAGTAENRARSPLRRARAISRQDPPSAPDGVAVLGTRSDGVCDIGVGTPIDERGATYKGLRPALTDAGIDRHLSLHDLRHTAASLVIAQGANVVYVAHQLGHSSPTITLSTYARLFDHAEHADAMRDRMEAAFAASAPAGG